MSVLVIESSCSDCEKSFIRLGKNEDKICESCHTNRKLTLVAHSLKSILSDVSWPGEDYHKRAMVEVKGMLDFFKPKGGK